ncbi:MAG: helix-turn-helix transcriptional regulator [Pseudomonadota bacterium]|jgi:DNA-binding XRE family transcriptional regulator|nr:XRE family transcriptional regulator [Pseudomonadota bacterium]QKK05912.1 MAG: helix-turn-helix transcriptional regulator [Pseudomonadota bacterium]
MAGLEKKIVAARALLDWTQEALAQEAAISKPSIVRIEKGQTNPEKATLDAIESAFNAHGVFITEFGVEHREVFQRYLSGKGWYLKLLEDVQRTVAKYHDPEMLIDSADDSVSPPEVVEKYKELRTNGIKMRQLVREGNTYLMGKIEEYRYIPEYFFNNHVTLIYGQKVAMKMSDNGCLIIKNEKLSANMRNSFNYKWSKSEQAKESTADVRF